MDDPRTDAELLAATREDIDAFGIFYRRHVRGVLGAVARRTGDPELAADIAAETFAAAMLSTRRYDPARGTPTQWLYGIVGHTMSASARRAAAERRARRRLGMEPVPVESDDARWIESLAESEAGREAMGLLDELPANQRELVSARVIGERSYGELSIEYGLPEATVRKRVSRGLSTLRSRLRSMKDTREVSGQGSVS